MPSGGGQRVETVLENAARIALPAEQFGIGEAVDLPGQNPEPLVAEIGRRAVMIERLVNAAVHPVDAGAAPERQGGLEQPFADHPRRGHRTAGMGDGQRRPFAGFLDAAGNVLDQVRLVAVDDEQRVGLGDDDDVVEPGDCQQAVLGAQIAVVNVDGQHVAEAGIAVGIQRRSVMQLVPRPQIVPVEAGRDNADARGVFHDRVVDGDLRAGGKGLLVEPEALALDFGALDGQPGLGPDLGLLAGEFGAHLAGAEHEDAGVPEEAAGAQEFLGGLEIGFLAKPGNIKDRTVPGAALDVAILGFGPGRGDADGHDAAALGECPGAGADDIEEGCRVRNLVVGRQHQHHAVGIGLGEIGNGGGDRGRGVADQRFEHVALDLDAAGFSLLGEQRFEADAADNAGRQVAQALALVVDTFERVGQQRLVVDEAMELFRLGIPRHRPEPGSRAPAQDNWRDGMACDHEKLRLTRPPG